MDELVAPVGPSSTVSRLSRRTGPGARPVRWAHESLAAMTATGPGGRGRSLVIPLTAAAADMALVSFGTV